MIRKRIKTFTILMFGWVIQENLPFSALVYELEPHLGEVSSHACYRYQGSCFNVRPHNCFMIVGLEPIALEFY